VGGVYFVYLVLSVIINYMLKIGATTGGPSFVDPIKDRIKHLLSIDNQVIELGLLKSHRIENDSFFDEEDIYNLKQFKHVSIHAPGLFTCNDSEDSIKRPVRYPSKDTEFFIEKLIDIAKSVNARAILFHPDLVDDFPWLNEKIGDLLVFENMDNLKKLGRTVEDMEKVFKQSPQSRWVCDINHIYTNDKTMKLADEFYAAFKDRLAYYHVSSYGDIHDCFSVTKEDTILKGIKDISKPLVHEGGVLAEKGLFEKEIKYIEDKLNI